MRVSLETLKELLDYHYDRRERLYQFLAQIQPEEFVRPMNVGWNSIQGTLMHCLFAEDFWVQYRLQKKAATEDDFARFPDLPSVVEEARAVRARTLSFVAGLTDEALAREESFPTPSGFVVTYPVSRAFLHVINHDSHHCGQVVALARQLGYEPPELDLL